MLSCGGRFACVSRSLEEMHKAMSRWCPEGDVDLSSYLDNIAENTLLMYRTTAKLDQLEFAISAYEAAVALSGPGNDRLGRRAQNLGTCFRNRFQRLGHQQDSDTAFGVLRRAMELDPTLHNRWGLTFLDQLYDNGIKRDAALEIAQKAVETTPQDHPDFLDHLGRLTLALLNRYEQLHEVKDLKSGLQQSQIIVEMIPSSHPQYAEHLFRRSIFLRYSYEASDETPDLEAALADNIAAVDLTAQDNPEWSKYLKALPLLYAYRYDRIGDFNDVESCQNYVNEYTAYRHKQEDYRVSEMAFYGELLMARYHKFGDSDNLDLAFYHFWEPMKFTPDHWPEHTVNLANLAKWYIEDFRGKRDEDIHYPVDYGRQLISLTTDSDSRRPEYLNILGQALKARFHKLGDPNDLTEGLKAIEHAVQLTANGHARRGKYLETLAAMHFSQFTLNRKFDDLKIAVDLAQAAVDETQPSNPSFPRYLHRLAEYTIARYWEQQDVKDVNKVFDTYHQSFTTSKHPNCHN
ncbi:hypothetical protein B0H11DRAFT_850420 [Mycena galericulata]|nr:hypothetical protein B0H11DRAFT_850420 [Mycena galericulata]